MATINSAGSGNWSAGGTWVGGVAPTNADDAVILNTHTVTLNTTGLVCKSCTVNSGGTLNASTTANSDLTVGNGTGDTANIAAGNGAIINIDLSAASAYSCTIYLNDGANTSGLGIYGSGTSSVTLKGVNKKRWTRLNGAITAGATSATVYDATGWAIGDLVIFGTTQPYNATPRIDIVTLTSVSGTSIGWTGGITYDHADNGYVGNFSSNVTIRPSGTNRAYCAIDGTGGLNVQDVAFNGLSDSTTFGRSAFSVNGGPSSGGIVSNNAFYTTHANNGTSIFLRLLNGQITRDDNVVYCTAGSATGGAGNANYAGNWNRLVVFRAQNTGFGFTHAGESFVDCVAMSVMANGAVTGGGNGNKIVNCSILASSSNFYCGFGVNILAEIRDSKIGTEFGAYSSNCITWSGGAYYNLTDCYIQTSGTIFSGLVNAARPLSIGAGFVNKDAVVTTQEQYYPHCEIKRNNSTVKRSTSSISIKPVRLATDSQRTQKILCANGSAIRVIGYCQFDTSFYNSNDYTAPTVTLSGLGATTQTYTATSAANGAWEKFDLSITNSSGSDGEFTLAFTADAKTVTTGIVYFTGVPDAPFVTKCRHYGFLFDESSPIRTVNSSVDVSEATASAYTNITPVHATLTTTIGASKTLQQVYDYTQYWACENLTSTVPLTGAGSSGAVSMLAAHNITVSSSSYTLNGGGSINMGSKTLTNYFSGGAQYTYTGGTWSQATTVPTFTGGTLNIGAAGTYTYTQAAAMILSMTPTAPGIYVLGGCTFTGQVDLRNTSGTHAITVELPSGTSYTTANNTGAAITVTLPSVVADISITGMPNAGAVPTRLQIFNSTAVSAVAWQAATAYASGDVRLRTTGVGTENTAGLYMRCTTAGTSGGTEPTWNTTPGGTTNDGTVVWTTYKVLFYDADPASTSYATTYTDGNEFLAGETVKGRFAEMNGGTSFKVYSGTAIASASGFSMAVEATALDVFATYGLDGSTYETTFSPNYTSNYLILDTNTDFSGKSAFAYFCYLLTTSQGMYRFWGGLTALDAGNIRIESDVLNLYFDESAGFVKQTDDVRIFRKDGTRPALDPTTGGNGIEINWRTPVSVVSTGGSALTPTESAKLMGLPSANTIAQEVVNGITF